LRPHTKKEHNIKSHWYLLKKIIAQRSSIFIFFLELKYKQELTASAKEQLLTGDDVKERAELKEKKKAKFR
jgi:hypothetical protein